MKRTILINQEVLFSIDQRLDFIDAAIFHYIVDFSPLCDSRVDKNSIWFWVSGSKIIEDMPMLKISTNRGISKRIDKLIDANLLVRHPENKATTQSFFTFGSNYFRLIATNESSDLRTTVPSTLEQPFQAPRNNRSKYNSIKDNSISDISNSDFEKKSQTEIPSEEEIETLEAEEVENYSLDEEKERKKKVAPKKKEMDLFGDYGQVENETVLWPSFEDFWELYDKKTGKEKSQKKWDKLKQSEKEKIMEVVPDYVASQPDKQYRKNPETYLNGKHWNDEIIFKQSKMTADQRIMKQNGLNYEDLAKAMMS